MKKKTVVDNPSCYGLPEGYRRYTTIIKNEYVEQLGWIAYWSRISKRDLFEAMVEGYLKTQPANVKKAPK
jgi:hypothetical protein